MPHHHLRVPSDKGQTIMDWIDQVLNEGEKELGDRQSLSIKYLDSMQSEVKEQLMKEQ